MNSPSIVNSVSAWVSRPVTKFLLVYSTKILQEVAADKGSGANLAPIIETVRKFEEVAFLVSIQGSESHTRRHSQAQ